MAVPGTESGNATVPPQGGDITTEVVVLGGGLAGLTMAAALASAGVPVVCIDQDSPERMGGQEFDIRTTAISYASKMVLEAAGVWHHMADQAGPMLDIRIADQFSPLFIHYDHTELAMEGKHQPFGWILDNKDIRRALFTRAAELPGLAADDPHGPVAPLGVDDRIGEQLAGKLDRRQGVAQLVAERGDDAGEFLPSFEQTFGAEFLGALDAIDEAGRRMSAADLAVAEEVERDVGRDGEQIALGACNIVERMGARQAGEDVLDEIMRILGRDSTPGEIAQQHRVIATRQILDGDTAADILRSCRIAHPDRRTALPCDRH